jgi:YD repeat-containing protein
VTTKGAATSSTSDYEQYGYDDNGNRTSLRKRDVRTIQFEYDRLNRETHKSYPNGGATEVYRHYDLAGRPEWVRFTSDTGPGIVYGYDGAKRLQTERAIDTGYDRTLTFGYDAAGNRTRLTFPDTNYIQYDYDELNRLSDVRENGASSGVGVLAHYTYDALSRRDFLTRGNGTTTDWGYDAASRLNTLSADFTGSAQDLTRSFTHNLASQIHTRASSSTLFDWVAPTPTNTPY